MMADVKGEHLGPRLGPVRFGYRGKRLIAGRRCARARRGARGPQSGEQVVGRGGLADEALREQDPEAAREAQQEFRAAKTVKAEVPLEVAVELHGRGSAVLGVQFAQQGLDHTEDVRRAGLAVLPGRLAFLESEVLQGDFRQDDLSLVGGSPAERPRAVQSECQPSFGPR